MSVDRIVVLALARGQLGALAMVEQYVYRALDDARQRPRYVIEVAAGRRVSAQPAVE